MAAGCFILELTKTYVFKNHTIQSLKVSTIYAPPNHDKGTVHLTKKEAENEEYGRTSKFC